MRNVFELYMFRIFQAVFCQNAFNAALLGIACIRCHVYLRAHRFCQYLIE